MCMTRKIRKIDIKIMFSAQRLFYFLKGFFDSVDFRLNRVGRRDKTAQSLVFSEKSLQIRLMMESGI